MPERWPDADNVSVAQHRDARDVIMRVSSVGIVLPTSPALSSLSFLHALFWLWAAACKGGVWVGCRTDARAPAPPAWRRERGGSAAGMRAGAALGAHGLFGAHHIIREKNARAVGCMKEPSSKF